jgi:hypothetical protein
MSTSPTDHNANDSPPFYSIEVQQMLMDPESVERITQEITNDITAILINNLHFLTLTIRRLEAEVNRHKTEFDSIIDFAAEHQHFRRHLRPALQDFRRRSQNPYPPTTTSPSLRSNNASEESLPALFPIDNPPRTEEIHSPDPHVSDEPLSPSPETTSLSFRNTNEGLLGSQSNPINVDLIPDHLVRLNTGMRRSRSTLALLYCQTCRRHGHTSTTCIWYGPIVCGYCMEIGHGRKDCSNLKRDIAMYNPNYNFCMLCGQSGHTLVQCGALQYQQ